MVKIFHRAPGGFRKSDGTHVETYESFTVEVWQQPFWRWLAAVIYHWYNMRIGKVPGFKLVEKTLWWFHRDEPFIYVPLGCQQDIKCYHLSIKKRKVLAKFEVKEDSEIVKASWPS